MRRAVESLEPRRLFATGFVADLSAAGIDPTHFIPYARGTVFAATTPAHGQELWTTDGTAAGTHELFDLAPGTAGSSPIPVAAVGNLILFTAEVSSGRSGLWSTDGTLANTKLICPTISVGSLNASFGEFRNFGSQVAFVEHYVSQNRSDLFLTDGSTVKRLFTVQSQPDGSVDLSTDDRYLYFWAGYDDHRSLYRTNGRSRSLEIARGTEFGGGVGAGLNGQYVTPVIEGSDEGVTRKRLYAFDREANKPAKLLGDFYDAKVLGASGNSAVYVAAQKQAGQPYQIYRYDGKSLTALSKFKTGGYARNTVVRITADGLYFTDGGASIYFAGNQAARVVLWNTLPADMHGRTGSINDFQFARDGSAFIRSTLNDGQLWVLTKGQFHNLGQADSSSPLSIAGNAVVYSRPDATGFSETFIGRTVSTEPAQLTDLTGGSSDSGIRGIAPLGDGVAAVALVDLGWVNAKDRTHTLSAFAYAVSADGRTIQLGGAQSVARFGFDTPLIFTADSTVFFTVPRSTTSGNTADLYRSDGTINSALLVATDVGLTPTLIGTAGAYAFFRTKSAATVIAAPLHGRPRAFPQSTPFPIADTAVIAGHFVFAMGQNGQVLSFNGQDLGADAIDLSHLPAGTVVEGLQTQNNQLLLLTRQGTTASVYRMDPVSHALTHVGTFTGIPVDATPDLPIIGPNPNQLWALYNSAGTRAQLIQFDLTTGVATQTLNFVGQHLAFLPALPGATTGRMGSKLALYDEPNHIIYTTSDGTMQAFGDISITGGKPIVGGNEVFYTDGGGNLTEWHGGDSHTLANANQFYGYGAFADDRLWFIGRDAAHGREIWTAQYAVGTIRGSAFIDNNGNGARDSGDAGIDSLRVFIDLNGNGKFDRNADLWQYTMADGGYEFDDVPAGNYVVSALTNDLPTSTPTGYHVKLARNAAVARYFGLLPF